MKADRSRDTFDPSKHYRRVLHQQGRVVLDADDNEQVSIDLAASEATLTDVIGQAGVPDVSLASGYAGGFAIGLANFGGSASSSSSSSAASSSAASSSSFASSSSSSSSGFSAAVGNDLTIAHGRIYVDGILIVNDADTTLFTQPWLPLYANDVSPTGLAGAGVYAVYLDAWERVVTPIDDPNIQEIALGGPDTCLRSQVVWQVRLGPIDTDEFGQNPVCGQILPPWPQNDNPGLLTAGMGAPAVDATPCSLPPTSGYRSLENQLYRVEIHTAGGYQTAAFKWSRENGSVVFGILPAPGQSANGTVSGAVLNVMSTGRDASLGVKQGDWVELIDDRSEFARGRGELMQVQSSDAASMTITLASPPSQPIDLSRHPKLRRWDQDQDAGTAGIVIADGAPIDLENGVQVSFSNGQYAVGDYWLIPARTATSQQTVGTIEWPADDTGQYLPEPPRGVTHHYCKLGIVAFDGANFKPPQGASAVTDCRLFFPPLTEVQAQQSACTLTLHPADNWVALLAALFPGNVPVDAEICFAVGRFTATQPVIIDTTGNVKISGAGWGTQLTGQGLETVLRFKNCASVMVRELSATATRVDGPVDAVTARIGGALEFVDCNQVNVDRVNLTCGAALASGAAGLTVRNTITAANAATGSGTVHVSGSRFTVGQMQYGMLLVHVQNAFVEDNELLRAPGQPTAFGLALQYKPYLNLVARILVGGVTPPLPSASSSSSASVSSSSSPLTASLTARNAAARRALSVVRSPALATSPNLVNRALSLPNTGVSVGKVSVTFNTPPQLKGVWQAYLDTTAPKEFATGADLLKFVKTSATTLLTTPALRNQFSGFKDLIRLFENNQVAMARAAVVVGGRGVTTVRVANNVIDGFLQGVVVGVSHKERAPPAQPADTAGNVIIRDNRIGIVVDPVLGRAAGRYAISVGNVDSLQIENNRATLTTPGTMTLPNEGIHVFGYLGRKVIVRHNHLSNFSTGIHVTQVTARRAYDTVQGPPSYTYFEPRQGPQWLVADNMVEKAGQFAVYAPSCLQINNSQA